MAVVLDKLVSAHKEGISEDNAALELDMPVIDGYKATRILRSKREYTLEEDDDESMEKMGAGEGRRGRLSDIPVIAMTASAI
jgi:CheY-like chemotaxis protein